jgi:Peptidase family M23/LysM domain
MFRVIQIRRIVVIGMIILGAVSMSFTVSTNFLTEPPVIESGEDPSAPDSVIVEEVANPNLYDTSGVFARNWLNDQTFAYMQSKETFTDSTVVEICNAFHDFCYPVQNKINSPFGYRGRTFHKGIDIDLERGDTVLAAFDGIVRYAKYNNGGFGNLVIIRHHNGLETYYAHLTKLKVSPDDTVRAGEFIGTGGNTGARHSGPHLHFEVRIEDKPINPARIFDTKTFSLNVTELTLSKDIFSPRGTHTHKHTAAAIPPVTSKSKFYHVRKGDNLGKIASRHGTSIRTLCRLNRLTERSVLQIGQKIRIH